MTKREEEKKLDLNKQRELIAKLIQLRNVLERDKFEGLNRNIYKGKVQL